MIAGSETALKTMPFKYDRTAALFVGGNKKIFF
jgi:hypothetical protein